MCSKEQGYYQTNGVHWHIDNGGISLNCSVDEYGSYPIIEIRTEYFGYPSVSAVLSGHISPEAIKQIGQELIRFSKDIELLRQIQEENK